MHKTERKLLDKRLVHKETDDNVLIFNLRREVPHFIPEHVYNEIIEKISLNDISLLNSNYDLVSTEKLAFLDNLIPNYYVLNSVIYEINEEQAEYIADNKPVQDQAFIFLLYEPAKETDGLTLFKNISEEEEMKILNILDLKDRVIKDTTKKQISEVFEDFDEVHKSDIIYTSMFVNTNHPFFFEHPNDHIPGMMIIEAFRQFVVAVNHVFGKVPIEDAQLVLECLNSKFFKYGELALPVTLKGYIKECEWSKRGYWSFLDFEADAIQRSDVLASFRLYGKIISTGVFKKLRRSETGKLVRLYQFVPDEQLVKNFSIKSLQEKKYIDASLVYLSYEGFIIHSSYFSENENADDFSFSIFIENIGFVNGQCQKVWDEDDKCISGLKITSIDNDDVKRFAEIIIKHCQVQERERL